MGVNCSSFDFSPSLTRIVVASCGQAYDIVTAPSPASSGSGQVHRANTAYRLVVMEQLVPALSDDVLRDTVFPYCVP